MSIDDYPAPLAAVPVVHTVQIRLGKKLKRADLDHLRNSCLALHVDCRPLGFVPRLNVRLMLHAKDVAAFGFLDRIIVENEIPFLINRVDLALDYLVADERERDRLQQFINQHLVTRWHGKNTVKYFKGTRYTTARTWGCRQDVLYSDKPSVTSDDLCVHLEHRAKGKAAVERLGVYDLGQLISFDHRGFWERHLRLEAIDHTMLGRQRRHAGRAKAPLLMVVGSSTRVDMDFRAGNILAWLASESIYGTENPPDPTAQTIRDAYRHEAWFNPRTCLTRLPIEPFLPS